MHTFNAPLELIGINPFVQLPPAVLLAICAGAGRDKGPIRVRGMVNDRLFRQTLVRYAGLWRLYINLTMLPNSPRRIGEMLTISLTNDSKAVSTLSCPALDTALAETPEAQRVFDNLPTSRQLEVVRYLVRLKTSEALRRNVERAIGFLLGHNSFAGRSQP